MMKCLPSVAPTSILSCESQQKDGVTFVKYEWPVCIDSFSEIVCFPK